MKIIIDGMGGFALQEMQARIKRMIENEYGNAGHITVTANYEDLVEKAVALTSEQLDVISANGGVHRHTKKIEIRAEHQPWGG